MTDSDAHRNTLGSDSSLGDVSSTIRNMASARSASSSGIELPEELFPTIINFGSPEWDHGLNDHRASFSENKIVTSKYTVLSFLPINLTEQFQKAANVYFVVMSLLMFIGNNTNLFVSAMGPFTILGVLVLMMALSALVAGIDDYKRHQADKNTNHQVVKVWIQAEKALRDVQWGRIAVGDIIYVEKDEEFPADIIPLACSGEDGTCYVSTANLDGETNLKIKSAVAATSTRLGGSYEDFTTSTITLPDEETPRDSLLHVIINSTLPRFKCKVQAEKPQKSIHNFAGRVILDDEEHHHDLLPTNLLLRGTQLQNTAWCLGGVVYTGKNTRLAMNSQDMRGKLANLEIAINHGMKVILAVQAALAFTSSLMYCISKSLFIDSWYLFPDGDTEHKLILPEIIAYWLTFTILYSNLMPISLYACMEVCNGFLAYFIKCDRQMYDEAQDCHAAVNSTNLVHELGQVSYVFSDKTGTLTQNIMELAKISVDGKIYDCRSNGIDGLRGNQVLMEPATGAFLENLAVCHTVMAIDDNGELKYEAESPDEEALVNAAATFGWSFSRRSGGRVIVDVKNTLGAAGSSSSSKSYSVLALNAFTSDRKRMSMILETPTGQIVLLIKGADNFILERAVRNEATAKLENDLNQFAVEGLRTLVLARRYLDEETCQAWLKEYNRAQAAGANRTEELAAAAEKIEVQLEILGATAIEDKLQVGVPETIQRIRDAGIKLWVLTGDKVETAINIGKSTNVLDSDMTLLQPPNSNAVVTSLLDLPGDRYDDLALIVTGSLLEEVYSSDGMASFYNLASKAAVVIACRVSPKQKADMVQLVRESEKPTPVTLAIGDGANDVPMILSAQIGVGISGREGRQAVNSSDFSIAQFRFLQRLLLVHGHWNYRRACKFILYTYWKNSVLVLVLFYYNMFSGFSGTSMFEDMVWTSFNIVLAWPIMGTCIFDQDVNAATAIENPRLYASGRLGHDLNQSKIVWNFLSAFVHSFIPFGMIWLALEGIDFAGIWDYYSFGTAMYSWLVVSMNYRAAFATSTWNWISVACVVASFLSYVIFLGGYCSLNLNPAMYGVYSSIAVEPIFWLGMFIVPTLAMALDILKTFLQIEFLPDDADLAQELLKEPAPPAPEPSNNSLRARLSTARSTTPNANVDLEGSIGSTRDRLETSFTSYARELSSSFVFDHPGDLPRNLSTLRQPSRHRRNVEAVNRFRRGVVHRARALTTSSCNFLGPESKFAQQELRSKQFQHDWRITALAMFGGGTVLAVVGVLTVLLSQGSYRIDIHYDGPQDPPFIKPDSYEHLPCPTNGNTTNHCVFNYTVPTDMHPPISVFYTLKPFYQSYQSYLTSVVYSELQGQIASKSERKSVCFGSTLVDSEKKNIVPCGLQATSLFNDTFEIVGVDIDTSKLLDDAKIKFANPPDYPKRADVSWLYERYPTVIDKENGVNDPRFYVWMKPSALARLSKPYGNIDSMLKKGQTITIRINASFPVNDIKADKRIAIASKSILGGSNVLLYRVCFVTGAICYLFGFCVIVIQKKWRREPGQRRPCVRRHGTEENTGDVRPTSMISSSSTTTDGSIVPPLQSSMRTAAAPLIGS